MPKQTTQARMVSQFNFEAYALLWDEVNPASLIFTRETDIGDPHRMIGMAITHTYWAREDMPDAGGIGNPFLTTAEVGRVVNARRDKSGLWIRGKIGTPPQVATDPRLLEIIIDLVRKGSMALTPGTLVMSKNFLGDDNKLIKFPIVQFALYVPEAKLPAQELTKIQ